MHDNDNDNNPNPPKKMGRPSKGDTLDKTVTFLVSSQDCRILDDLAAAAHKTRGAYLRDLITQEFLRENDPPESHEDKIARLRVDGDGRIYVL